MIFEEIISRGHEQVSYFHDPTLKLKGIVAIHNTVLGPALGGCRMWNYKSEKDALIDVLRLSKGMTYKAAIAGLNLGGGKAVIIGDAKTQKTPELMKRFGEFVHSLSGKYITAEDVGMETADMDTVREVTPYVTGISEEKGGAGNPSPSLSTTRSSGWRSGQPPTSDGESITLPLQSRTVSTSCRSSESRCRPDGRRSPTPSSTRSSTSLALTRGTDSVPVTPSMISAPGSASTCRKGRSWSQRPRSIARMSST